MAERKVLNKYYPPDFDPSKLRRFEKKSVRKMCNVRMMLPMSVRCYTCGNYMYIGTKFNMKVETVKDEDYLGIKIYRFYFKCTQCYSEITFRTDPKNHDYIAEWGASRNHEPWKDMLMAEEEYKEMKQNEMKEDAMKSLEHRTYDSKREMDILDALDQVKSLNRRQASVNYDEIIDKAINKEREKESQDMENEIQKEVDRIYERVKIRRIRDYENNTNSSDNMEEKEKIIIESRGNINEKNKFSGDNINYSKVEDEDDKDLGLLESHYEENSNYEKVDIKGNSINILDYQPNSGINLNFSVDDERYEIKEDQERFLNRKTKREGNDLLEYQDINGSEGRANHNSCLKLEEKSIKLDVQNNKESIANNLLNKNSEKKILIKSLEPDINGEFSDDSIEEKFKQNKNIFNLAASKTKLCILKKDFSNNKPVDHNVKISHKNSDNPKKNIINTLNLKPIIKPVSYKNNTNISDNNNKKSGLSSLLTNYSYED